MKEFAIWGKPPTAEKDDPLAETLLFFSESIQSIEQAEKIKEQLERVHNCYDCRIQVIDGTIPDFSSKKLLNV